MPKKILIMGAAGRDFHNFNVCYRQRSDSQVVAFTATQIPDIADRSYPASLAGSLYPNGIPIYDEDQLSTLIRQLKVDEVVFSYSDVAYATVMQRAAQVNSAGASFTLLAAEQTMLRSCKPVVAVCAVRTGCGKSPTTRHLCELLQEAGRKPVVVRHPMPYGDLAKQQVQRFSSLADLNRHQCTFEEREEYEPLIEAGLIVFAGVDYAAILQQAESEGDLILWDGGNNDTPFFVPDVWITLTDPHRLGDERSYYPSETNLTCAHVIILQKADSANLEDLQSLERSIAEVNQSASTVTAALEIAVEKGEAVKGKRVVVVEDGPTLTHGGMAFGAGVLAAKKLGAAEIVDPRPYAVGSIAQTLDSWPHLDRALPAMGYGANQVDELQQSLQQIPCDLVLSATPIDLTRVLTLTVPIHRVRYHYADHQGTTLKQTLQKGWPELMAPEKVGLS